MDELQDVYERARREDWSDVRLERELRKMSVSLSEIRRLISRR